MARSSSEEMPTGLAIIIVIGWVIVGAMLWPYIINTWLLYYGKPASILWLHGALLGFVPYLGKLTIPLAVLTWIALKFIV